MTVTTVSGAVDWTLTPLTVTDLTPLEVLTGGSIFSSAAGNLISGSLPSVSIQVSGSIHAASATAISVSGRSQIDVGATGSILSLTAVNMSGGSLLTNAGTIRGDSTAVIVNASHVVNTGVISSGANFAISLESGNVTVVNSGTILGGITEDLNPGGVYQMSLVNTGVIEFLSSNAVSISSGINQVVNSGTISGLWNGIGGSSYYNPVTSTIHNDGSIVGTYTGLGMSIYKHLIYNLDNNGLVHGGNNGVYIAEYLPLESAPSKISLVNGVNGLIDSDMNNAIFVQVTMGTITLNNSGIVRSGGNNVYDPVANNYPGPVVALQGRTQLTNSGTIVATDQDIGIAVSISGVTGAKVENSGTISGVTAMFLTQASDVVHNSGHINGDLTLGAGDDRVFSAGVIVGTVDMGLGNDTLDAGGGRIRGEVFLGDGNDVIDLSGAVLRGVVHGGLGDDLFIVSDSTATLQESAGQGADTVQSSVDFLLAAGQEIETLQLTGLARIGVGNEFANTLNGDAADNVLIGNAGADTMSGFDGDDRLNGGTEADRLSGNAGDDSLFGDAGNDVLIGGTGNDVLYGMADNDNAQGGEGEDRIFGGLGADSLTGNAGNDTLVGGKGADTLTGGADDDTFVFQTVADSGKVAALTNDVITDFAKGVDTIDLSSIDANRTSAGNDGFTYIGSAAFSGVAGQLHYVVSAGNLILEGDVDGNGTPDFQILVMGLTSFNAADLVL